MSGATVQFETETVILGRVERRRESPEFSRPDAAEVWPSVVFPRAPIGFRFERAGEALGDQNTAVLFNVGEEYTRRALDAGGSRTEWIELRPDVMAEIVSRHDPRAADRADAPFPFAEAPAPDHAFAARRLLSLEQDPLALEERAVWIVAAVVGAGFRRRGASPRRESTARAHRGLVRHARETIARRMRDGVALAALAREAHAAPFHLCRVFRAETGMSVHAYLDTLRLRASLDLLLESRLRHTEIALSLGYCSEAHFSGAFRRRFGCGPRAARQMAARGHIDELRRALGNDGRR